MHSPVPARQPRRWQPVRTRAPFACDPKGLSDRLLVATQAGALVCRGAVPRGQSVVRAHRCLRASRGCSGSAATATGKSPPATAAAGCSESCGHVRRRDDVGPVHSDQRHLLPPSGRDMRQRCAKYLLDGLPWNRPRLLGQLPHPDSADVSTQSSLFSAHAFPRST